MSYIIRSKDGTMKARITNSLANQIISNYKGHFDKKEYASGIKAVYILETDITYERYDISFFIWTGDFLVPD